MITAAQFVESARALVGVPWSHQGRTALGVDCIGLIILAGKNAGVDLFAEAGCPPVRRYGRRADPMLYRLVEKYCIPADQPMQGVVALFRFPGERAPRHFGVITAEGTMIHAEAKTRKSVIEHGYRMQWLRMTDSLWQLPGIRYE